MRERLRIDNQIVGYRKRMGAKWFYSPDEYGWSGTPVEFQQKDRCLLKKDLNGKMIYANDILVSSRGDIEEEHWVVHYDDITDRFLLLTLNGEENATQLLEEELIIPLKRVAYLFQQPH